MQRLLGLNTKIMFFFPFCCHSVVDQQGALIIHQYLVFLPYKKCLKMYMLVVKIHMEKNWTFQNLNQ